MRGEAEAVPKRAREHAGAGCRANEGEGGNLQRYGRGTRPLSNDDIDSKVLHGQVKHLLSRARGAVNLVEEQDLTRLETREHGGNVTGMLERRARRDAQGRLEFCGDDEGQCRLAQPRWTADEHVISRSTSTTSGFEHEAELRLHPFLPNEAFEMGRPKRAFHGDVVCIRLSVDETVIHERSRLRSAALRRTAISGPSESSA